VPHTGGDPDADYTEIGNPNLKRVTADNYDLRYEFFPKALDQLLVGVFYKRINNPIEFAITSNTGGATGYSLQANNFGTGTNYGFELDFTKYVHNFGIRANYTYTNSSITTTKYVRYRDASGNLTQRPEDQTRPLQGQSKNIGNVSLLYKSAKAGLDVQLALVYTGSRINSVSPYLDNDIWQKPLPKWTYRLRKSCTSISRPTSRRPTCLTHRLNWNCTAHITRHQPCYRWSMKPQAKMCLCARICTSKRTWLVYAINYKSLVIS
jgi:outer membrane receptor protein involved in Fe transport